MDIYLNIENRENVTVDSVTEFLKVLVKDGFTSSQPIDYIYVKCGDDEDRTQFDTSNIEEALQIIEKNGVESLSISFPYQNHYEHNGRPEGVGHFAGIMYSLNIASSVMAEEFGDDLSTDFYLSVIFSNGVYETEFGEVIECGIKFGGEGGNVDDLEKGAKTITRVMETEYPKFTSLVNIMNKIFGKTNVIWEYNEF